MKRIEEKVIKFIEDKNLIEKNDKILIAISGGPDSVFLIYFLSKFQKKYKIKLGAFHLNHSLRGKAADEDEIFCSKLSKKLSVEYYSSKKRVKAFAEKNKISVEEAGRIIRYDELERIRKKYNYNKIATAHNADDNAETVLLNLIKGTGISGLSGIPYKRTNIIRPVLNLSKKEILDYLDKNKLQYRIDESNFESEYQRNYLRNEVIPLIQKRLNPKFINSVFITSENIKNFKSYLDKQLLKAEKEICLFKKNILYINIKNLENYEKELWNEIIKLSVNKNFSLEINSNDLKEIISLIKNIKGKKIKLTGNLSAVRESEEIVILFSEKTGFFKAISINSGDKIPLSGETLTIKKSVRKKVKFSNNKKKEYISADNIEDKFIIRRWKQGDRFYPIGLKGSKKISDFLNEQKVTAIKKSNQLVLTNKNKIVWVLGLRLDERFKVTDKTKKVFELCLN